VGPLAVGLIAPLLAALKQKLVTYCLMAVGGLIAIFAAGYALDAIHSFLMFRYGGVAASLIIAASLLGTALVSVGMAFYLKGRPSTKVTLKSSPHSNPPSRNAMSRESTTAIAAAVAGAVTAGTVIASSKRLRTLMAGTRPVDQDSLQTSTASSSARKPL
jgi:hypothetical protein